MWRINLLILIIGMLLATPACRSFDEPTLKQSERSANITLQSFVEKVGDRSLVINEPLVVGGYVISSDEESNFYKSLVIDDGTAAIEIMVGLYDSFNLYPLGYYLEIDLQGCGAGRHYGVVQVGRPAKEYGSFPAEYFASRVLLDKHIVIFDDYQEFKPLVCEIGALEESLCGRLVTIEGLQLVSAKYPDAWEVNLEGEWQGYNFFEDKEGHTIVVYTSEYATYGEHLIPEGELSITGVLQWGTVAGEERFMLKMRYEEDCQQML